MTDTDYNGWANYQTWVVNLWLGNDESLYRQTLEAVRDEYEAAPSCTNVAKSIWTVDEARRYNTADHLREIVEELAGDAYNEASFVSDLLGYAFGEVDWYEIADEWLVHFAEAASLT